MALIQVGIHENLTLSDKSKINEQGSLELVISMGGSTDVMAALEGNTVAESNEQSYRFYPPNLKDFSQNVKTPDEIVKDFLKMRATFMEYAKLFADESAINEAIGGFKLFEGTGVSDPNTAISMLTKEEYVKKVSTNLGTKFLQLLHDSNAFDGKVAFRQKFVRQSKAKHFSTVPPYNQYSPFIEPMTVPKEDSAIEFTAWEIDNGKNDGKPVSSTPAQSTPVDETKASALFGGNNTAPELDAKEAKEPASPAGGLFPTKEDSK